MATKLLAVQKLGKLFAHFFVRFDKKSQLKYGLAFRKETNDRWVED